MGDIHDRAGRRMCKLVVRYLGAWSSGKLACPDRRREWVGVRHAAPGLVDEHRGPRAAL